jgi:hypothetical protein
MGLILLLVVLILVIGGGGLLLRSSIRRWPRLDPADRRFGPAVQGLIVAPLARVVCQRS